MPFVERCPVCGGDRIDPYAMDAWAPPALHFAQSRCAGCGLLISQPQASEAEMDAYYGRSYFEEQWPDSDAIWLGNTDLYKRYELPLMRQLWADWPPPPGATAHWRMYKGRFCAVDRRIGHGEFLMAVGRRAHGR